MKHFYKNPFWLGFLAVLLVVSATVVIAKPLKNTSIVKKALAAAVNITGQGTVNFLAAFAGGTPSNQIGDSIIYDDGAGHIGIGTTNPTGKLSVNGNMTFDTAANNIDKGLYWASNNDASWGRIYREAATGRLWIDAQTGAPLTLNASNAGNVGIGTASPGSKLDVNGGVTTNGTVVVNNGYVYGYNNAYPIRLGELWGQTGLWNGASHAMLFGSDAYFQFLNRSGGYGPPLYAQDYYINASGKWASQLASPIRLCFNSCGGAYPNQVGNAGTISGSYNTGGYYSAYDSSCTGNYVTKYAPLNGWQSVFFCSK